jgi:hypothetical protein
MPTLVDAGSPMPALLMPTSVDAGFADASSADANLG